MANELRKAEDLLESQKDQIQVQMDQNEALVNELGSVYEDN